MVFKSIIVVLLIAVVVSLFWSFWHLIRHAEPDRKVLNGLALRVVLSGFTLAIVFVYLWQKSAVV